MNAKMKEYHQEKLKEKNIQNKISDTLVEARKLIQAFNASEENSDDTFAHYVKMRLREIKDPMLKEKARLEIQYILFKYQMECVNK